MLTARVHWRSTPIEQADFSQALASQFEDVWAKPPFDYW